MTHNALRICQCGGIWPWDNRIGSVMCRPGRGWPCIMACHACLPELSVSKWESELTEQRRFQLKWLAWG
eukprot:3855053-Amphidinium_carterae.1